MLMPLVASAHDFEFNGIYYNITSEADKTVEVTFRGDDYDSYTNEYSGSITIPATVTHNGVEYSVTSIGSSAFDGCSSLTAITIPESVTSIGTYAFGDCSSLTSITIPEGVTSIGKYAFYGCKSLTAVHISSIEAWCKISFEDSYSNPLYYVHNLYLNGELVTELVIPEGVTSIGSSAFYNCSSLTAITIPEGVTSIGDWAFSGCSSLTTITIPESVTSIGGHAFGDCSSLTAITIPEGVTSIGWRAFYYCSSLTALNIPESVTSIGDEAFYKCSSLTAITIPEDSKLTSIGKRAFDGCSSLTAINIPESVTSIGEGAFYNCNSLYKVINYSDLDIQKGSTDNGYVAYYAEVVYQVGELTTIGDFQFYTSDGIHSLVNYIGKDTGIVLPDSYNGESYNIGDFTFYDCSNLTAITIPEGVTSIGDNAFYNCSSLTTINIPENSQLTSIGERAFSGCSSLTAITIPESVTSIERSTFQDCSSLKELTLGKGLKKIGVAAFYGCDEIEKVTIYATRPPSIDGTGNAFFSDATYENATLYVPQGCIDKYQVMTGWSSFYTIEEMEGGTPNYLTLRQADNGEVGIVVEPGRTYKVRITAFEGWKIHSVTFNGEEVTAQLTEEGTFTTPALSEDAVLNIAYEKIEDDAMVENASASRIKVQGHHGTLRITGATEGEAISVYTMDGMLVAQESAEESETELTLPTGQVYIVTTGDKVVKIAM